MKLARKFNYVFACNKFYTIAKKDVFIKLLGKGVKPGGQMIFTDFVTSDESQPAIQEWAKAEWNDPHMISKEQMMDYLKKSGFIAMPAEDLTGQYKKIIARHLTEFHEHITKVHPDKETSDAVMQEISLWSARAKALENGLSLCLFVGVKK
jgi:cyclopropane fatty-acyl-phospholipid synthase-like methyltransferase